MRYARYASVLRWLTLSLFAYVATVFAVGVPWPTVALNLVVPRIEWTGSYLTVLVAVFGTTISPYLFFWQASEEVEDEREDPAAEPLLTAPAQAPRQLARIRLDTIVGMAASNLVALFIMLTTAATLHAHGVTDIADFRGRRKGAAADRGRVRLRGVRARHRRHRPARRPGFGREARLTRWAKRSSGASASRKSPVGLRPSIGPSRPPLSSARSSIFRPSTRSRPCSGAPWSTASPRFRSWL